MIFNFWRPYPFLKPKVDGDYLCTVITYSDEEAIKQVIELYYDAWHDIWKDVRRQMVFDGYKVYQSGRAVMEEHRVFTDNLCERENVIAWRKKPRVYDGVI